MQRVRNTMADILAVHGTVPFLLSRRCTHCSQTDEAVPEQDYSARLSVLTPLQTPEEKGDVDPYVELRLFDPAKNETEVQQSTHLVNEARAAPAVSLSCLHTNAAPAAHRNALGGCMAALEAKASLLVDKFDACMPCEAPCECCATRMQQRRCCMRVPGLALASHACIQQGLCDLTPCKRMAIACQATARGIFTGFSFGCCSLLVRLSGTDLHGFSVTARGIFADFSFGCCSLLVRLTRTDLHGSCFGCCWLQMNPKWGEKFDFVMASATSVLSVDVWDTLNWLEGRFSVKGLTGAPDLAPAWRPPGLASA
jgi:hypothetical protein